MEENDKTSVHSESGFGHCMYNTQYLIKRVEYSLEH